jgi:hypothetical protein
MRDVRLDIAGYTPRQVSYHVKLVAQAGLIEAVDFSSQEGLHWRAKALTWAGHEFLDAARDDVIWAAVQAQIRETGGAIPFQVMQALLMRAAAERHGV